MAKLITIPEALMGKDIGEIYVCSDYFGGFTGKEKLLFIVVGMERGFTYYELEHVRTSEYDEYYFSNYDFKVRKLTKLERLIYSDMVKFIESYNEKI